MKSGCCLACTCTTRHASTLGSLRKINALSAGACSCVCTMFSPPPLLLHAPQASCGFSSFHGGPARKTAVDKQIFWRIIIRMHQTPAWNSAADQRGRCQGHQRFQQVPDIYEFKKENECIIPPNSCGALCARGRGCRVTLLTL